MRFSRSEILGFGRPRLKLNTGLSHYWSLSSHPPAIVRDLAGGANGTPDSTLSYGGTQRALRWTGVDQAVVLPDGVIPNSDFGLFFWQTLDSGAPNNKILLQQHNSGAGRLILYSSGNVGTVVRLFLKNELALGPDIRDDRVHMVSVTRTGTTYELFVDGVSYGSATEAQSIGTGPCHIGERPDSTSQTHSGHILEVGLFERSVPIQEWQEIYRAGPGGFLAEPRFVQVRVPVGNAMPMAMNHYRQLRAM